LPTINICHRYENGINTFDTANVYSNGESERILGKALKVHNIPRENVVIMTKVRDLLRHRPLSSAHEGPHRSMVWFGTMTAYLSERVQMILAM
jgi:aryl-alcohol dehydrogenase-like predicted oxidoreductase